MKIDVFQSRSIGSLNWMLSSGKIHKQSDDNMFSDSERVKLTQLRNDLKSARKKLFHAL